LLCAYGKKGQIKIFFDNNISSYKIQPERSAKKDRGRTGRNSPRTPFPPRLHSGSGKEKVYKKIREYIYSFSVLSSDCKVCIELIFNYLKIRLRVFSKKSSNFGQKAQPTFTFCKIIKGFTGILRFIMVFFRYNPVIFKVTNQPAVGNAEVPALKRRENKIFLEPIFSLSHKAKDLSAFLFDCPKTDLKTI